MKLTKENLLTRKVEQKSKTTDLISEEEIERYKQAKREDKYYPSLPKAILTGNFQGIHHLSITLKAFYTRLENYEKAKAAQEATKQAEEKVLQEV